MDDGRDGRLVGWMGGWLTEERWKEEPPKDILVKR